MHRRTGGGWAFVYHLSLRALICLLTTDQLCPCPEIASRLSRRPQHLRLLFAFSSHFQAPVFIWHQFLKVEQSRRSRFFSLSFNMFQMIVCLLLLVCFMEQHVFVVDSNKLLLFCMFVATGKEVERNGIKGLFGLFLGATNCDFLLQFRNNNS